MLYTFSKKQCKYFNMGKGTCSFGSSCFYKHGEETLGIHYQQVLILNCTLYFDLTVYPDGTVAKDEPRYFTDDEGLRKPIRNST